MKHRKPEAPKAVVKGNARAQEGRKKAYASPRLTVHGTLETITEASGMGTNDAAKRSCLFDQRCIPATSA